MHLTPLQPAELSPLLRGYLDDRLDLYYGVARQPGELGHANKEMVRHLLAQLSQCAVCQAVQLGLTPEKIAKVTCPDQTFSPAERALLDFSGKLFAGHQHVGPADFAAMAVHFSPEAITEAGFFVSFLATSARLNFGFAVFED